MEGKDVLVPIETVIKRPVDALALLIKKRHHFAGRSRSWMGKRRHLVRRQRLKDYMDST